MRNPLKLIYHWNILLESPQTWADIPLGQSKNVDFDLVSLAPLSRSKANLKLMDFHIS